MKLYLLGLFTLPGLWVIWCLIDDAIDHFKFCETRALWRAMEKEWERMTPEEREPYTHEAPGEPSFGTYDHFQRFYHRRRHKYTVKNGRIVLL